MYGFLMRPDTLPKSYTSWCVNKLLPGRDLLEFVSGRTGSILQDIFPKRRLQ
jgi:hypothetical protein